MATNDIQSQKELLDQITTVNAQRLADAGITAKVMYATGITDPTATPFVTQQFLNDRGGTAITRIAVRVNETHVSPSNTISSTNRDVTVAEVINDGVFPTGGFSQDEASIVAGMARGLDETRELGLLPDLSFDLSDISDKTLMMQKAPPQT